MMDVLIRTRKHPRCFLSFSTFIMLRLVNSENIWIKGLVETWQYHCRQRAVSRWDTQISHTHTHTQTHTHRTCTMLFPLFGFVVHTPKWRVYWLDNSENKRQTEVRNYNLYSTDIKIQKQRERWLIDKHFRTKRGLAIKDPVRTHRKHTRHLRYKT
jgi:hypothetical protein